MRPRDPRTEDNLTGTRTGAGVNTVFPNEVTSSPPTLVVGPDVDRGISGEECSGGDDVESRVAGVRVEGRGGVVASPTPGKDRGKTDCLGQRTRTRHQNNGLCPGNCKDSKPLIRPRHAKNRVGIEKMQLTDLERKHTNTETHTYTGSQTSTPTVYLEVPSDPRVRRSQ